MRSSRWLLLLALFIVLFVAAITVMATRPLRAASLSGADDPGSSRDMPQHWAVLALAQRAP
ncbi:MAG: hypothetical protein RMJ55_05325 [Roseiflexaceae bacterium]|nr:hypothetical protein [Roseiflexaceae bacterium]